MRRAGRPFGRIIRIRHPGKPYVDGTSVATNATGDVLLVYGASSRRDTASALYARRAKRGRRFGRAQAVSRPTIRNDLRTALADDGSATIAWLTAPANFRHRIPQELWVATGDAGERFVANRVDRVRVVRIIEGPRLKLVAAPGGSPLLAWSGYQRGHFVVRAADIAESGRVLGRRTTSDPAVNTILADAELGPAGEAVIVGIRGIRGDVFTDEVGVVAAVRTRYGEPFGAVGPLASSGEVLSALAAIDPITGRILVSWDDAALGGAVISSLKNRMRWRSSKTLAVAMASALVGAGIATWIAQDRRTRIELKVDSKQLVAGEIFDVEVVPPENVCFSGAYRLMIRSNDRWIATNDLSAADLPGETPYVGPPEGPQADEISGCESTRRKHRLRIPPDARLGRYRLKKWFLLGDRRAEELADAGYQVSATGEIDVAWWVDFDVMSAAP